MLGHQVSTHGCSVGRGQLSIVSNDFRDDGCWAEIILLPTA